MVSKSGLVGVIVVIALAGRTASRVPVWHDNLTLWSATVAASPEKPRALNNLAIATWLAGDRDAARRLFLRELQTSADPRRGLYEFAFSRASAQTNLAWLAIEQGQWTVADRILADVIRDQPNFPYAHLAAAVVASAREDCAGMTVHLAQAAAQGVTGTTVSCGS